MSAISRRQFMKHAAIVGASVSVFPSVHVRKGHANWAKSTTIHPNIDNLRVVGLFDPNMTLGGFPNCSWTRQNELVARDVVWENMDKLACIMANTRDPQEAWQAIFVKPPGKPWADTVVAIKTNNISRQHTRSAVMSKMCTALTDSVGVKPSNIHIYDAVHGGNMRRDTPFSGLPEGCRIEDKWGGVSRYTAVPEPFKGPGRRVRCLSHIVDGSVDILVNIALCKGHSKEFGGFTMTMKNHFGTFSPRPGHRTGRLDYLIAINQTPEILGQIDQQSGRVLFPRQQLCLIDALWASQGGPGGNPTHQTNFLAMGVVSPVVDYVVATQFRGEEMGWQPNMEATRRMLEGFGYHVGDLPNQGKIISPPE